MKSIIEIATGHLGKGEVPKGSNWGPDVQKYLASVGINFPAAWCMAFVQYIVKEALSQPGVSPECKNPLKVSGGVLVTWRGTPKQFRVTEPKPGDIFIMDFGKGKGHTGFVKEVKGNRVYTIEGNSNALGSREGYLVCEKPGGRMRSSIVGFIRVPLF